MSRPARPYWPHSEPEPRHPAHATPLDPCVGPCNRIWRDAETEKSRTGQSHDYRPNLGEPLWCERCTDRVIRAVDDFPRLVAEIHNHALYGTPVPQERPGKHPKLAVAAWPGQSSRMLIEEVRDALLSLEDDTRELRGLTLRKPRGREGSNITAAAQFLHAHLPWIVEHHPISNDPEDAPAAYLLRLYARANRFIGGGTAVAELKVTPCPSCGCLSLAQQIGGRFIECGLPDCGRCLTREEYDQYTKMEAAYQSAYAACAAARDRD